MSKKFLRILAVSVAVLFVPRFCDSALTMNIPSNEWNKEYRTKCQNAHDAPKTHISFSYHATNKLGLPWHTNEHGVTWDRDSSLCITTSDLRYVCKNYEKHIKEYKELYKNPTIYIERINMEKDSYPGLYPYHRAPCMECYEQLNRNEFPIYKKLEGQKKECQNLENLKKSHYKNVFHENKYATLETREIFLNKPTNLQPTKMTLVKGCAACELAYTDFTKLLNESYSRDIHTQLNCEYIQLHDLQEEKRNVDQSFKSMKEEINLFKKEIQKKNNECQDLIPTIKKECKELSIAQKNQVNKFNEDLQKITIHIDHLKKENNEFKHTFSLFLQKFEESQKKHEEFEKESKQQITSLQEENKYLKQLFTNLPSINEYELFNMGREKFLNQTSISEKINLLYEGVSSYHHFIKNLKQKAKELGLEDVGNETISPSPSQILLKEEEIPEYCIPLLLKKDPSIFLPWRSSKEVHKLMYNKDFLCEDVLPVNIFVEYKKNKISLLSYIDVQKEEDLDVGVLKKGKKSFKKMVSYIEKIQGNFWENKEAISTVPMLVKKLNEGDKDKEWVSGWSTLGEEYKRYVTASVLYKKSKGSLPKKYEDIESYLQDK